MSLRKPFLQGLGLLVAALACAAVSNGVAGPQRRLAWVGHYEIQAAPAATAPVAAPNPSGSPLAPHPDRPWIEISADQAADLFRKGAPFFDARRTADYRAGHIAGARSFPVWEEGIDDKVKGYFSEGPDQSAPIVVYCSGGACEDSHMLAQKFYLAGFDNALVYRDGFPDWVKRGLPVHTGDQP